MSAIASAVLDCANGYQQHMEGCGNFVCGLCLVESQMWMTAPEFTVDINDRRHALHVYGPPGCQLPEVEREKLRGIAHREVLLGSVCQ